MIEVVEVPAHTTERMTTDSGWTFWRVRTGCVRVQHNEFTAYLQHEEAMELAQFILQTGEGEF